MTARDSSSASSNTARTDRREEGAIERTAQRIQDEHEQARAHQQHRDASHGAEEVGSADLEVDALDSSPVDVGALSPESGRSVEADPRADAEPESELEPESQIGDKFEVEHQERREHEDEHQFAHDDAAQSEQSQHDGEQLALDHNEQEAEQQSVTNDEAVDYHLQHDDLDEYVHVDQQPLTTDSARLGEDGENGDDGDEDVRSHPASHDDDQPGDEPIVLGQHDVNDADDQLDADGEVGVDADVRSDADPNADVDLAHADNDEDPNPANDELTVNDELSRTEGDQADGEEMEDQQQQAFDDENESSHPVEGEHADDEQDHQQE